MENETESRSTKPPGVSLSRWQLTGLLIGVPLFFVLVALLLSGTGKVLPEAKLDAQIHVAVETWAPPNSESVSPRMYPCAILKNPTNDPWRNVTIAINKQFYFNSHIPLQSGETLVVPLEQFVTKGGNVTFRPASQEVHRLTVFGQLPSGERGVFETREIDPLAR